MTDDFFRARLEQMIDRRHPLAVLARRIPWGELAVALSPSFERRDREGRVVAVNDLFGLSLQTVGGGVSAAGRPRLPIRLMASLLYLKHAFNFSDEELVERWSENVVWQYFSGREYYEPRLPCDATQVGRFRKAIGEAGVEELLRATVDTAVVTKAVRPQEFERIIVDTTVQEKAIAHPVDSRWLEIARAKMVQAAKSGGDLLEANLRPRGGVTAPKGRRLRPCAPVQAAAALAEAAAGHRARHAVISNKTTAWIAAGYRAPWAMPFTPSCAPPDTTCAG
jgi:IS5 family transposase